MDNKHQFIKDLENRIEIEVENLAFLGAAKDKEGLYWLITEGNEINNFQKQILAYDKNSEKVYQINLNEDEVPNLIKVIDNHVFVSVLTGNGSILYQYDTKAKLLDKTVIKGYLWDFYKELNTVYIVSHNIEKNLGKLYKYNMENKKLSESLLLKEFAPVSLVVHNNDVYIVNYHLEDNKKGRLLIIPKGNTENMITKEIAPHPFKVAVIDNTLFIFHYQVTARKGSLLTKVNTKSHEKQEFKVPESSKLIIGKDNLYFLTIKNDEISINKEGLQLSNADKITIPIKKATFITNF